MKRIFVVVACAVFAACGVHDSETLGSSSSALDLPGDLPLPNPGPDGKPQWNGSIADLYVADAWASCSFLATTSDQVQGEAPSLTPNYSHMDTTFDSYMTHVQGLMGNVSCTGHTEWDPWVRWYNMRTDENCNGGSAGKAKAPLEATAVPAIIDEMNPGTIWQNFADPIVRSPGVDACVAQKLRAASPGAAGAATLTLSSQDQRELLEYTRERAQQAVLGYAKLFQLGTSGGPTNLNSLLTVVQNWMLDPNNVRTSEMGALFINSLQLLTMTSTELMDLYGRSASARIPRGGPTDQSASDDAWGGGSWRERAFSLLYGGDPLTESENSPWSHAPAGPSFPQVKYVSADVREPQALDLLQFARQFDVVNLKVGPKTFNLACDIDLPASASRLYRAVEAAIETRDCAVQVSSVCQTVAPEASSLASPEANFQNFLLWQKYRIAFSTATSVVTVLSQQIGRICKSEPDGPTTELEGASDVLGAQSVIMLSGSDAGSYYHLDKDARLRDRSMLERQEGSYGGRGRFDVPPYVLLDHDEISQGFYYYNSYDTEIPLEMRRRLGVVPALNAVRELIYLVNTNHAGGSNAAVLLGRLLNNWSDEEDLISAAIGSNGAFLENGLLTIAPDGWTVVPSGPPSLVLYAPPDDSFWQQGQSSILAAALDPATQDFTGWLTGTLFLDPTTTTFQGATLTTALNEASGPYAGSATPPLNATKRPLARWVFSGVQAPAASQFTIVGKHDSSAGTSYRLIAGPMHTPDAATGTNIWVGTGGALNAAAERLMKVQQSNPSQPEYDGFGMPVRWVPPTNPTVLGNATGSDATTQYIADAQSAADSAVAAVTIAFNALLDQTKAQLDVSAQIQKSAQVVQAADKQMCGDNNPNCDVSGNLNLVDIPTLSAANEAYLLDATITSQHPASTGFFVTCHPPLNGPQPSDTQRQLACAAERIFESYEGSAKVAKPVMDALNSGVQSHFDDYAGGKLQEAFLNELYGYQKLQLQLEQVKTAYDLAEGHRHTAELAFANFQGKKKEACGPEGIAMALAACGSVSAGFASVSVSFSMAPLMAQIQKCMDAQADEATQDAQRVEAFATSVNDMAQEALAAANAGQGFVVAVAQGSEVIEGAKLTRQQANLDAVLASESQITNTGLYRRYHDYDVWRANALLESARRYAVVARRSVEARYVVDLSTMQESEPLVAGPALWADQVYAYDLNAPAAVGLTLAPQQLAGSIYPNVIVDYVGNLQRFVKGFAVQRPSTAAQADSDVISLPGPTGLATAGSLPPGVIDGSAYKWTFLCPADAIWHALPSTGDPGAGDPGAICGNGPPPTLARMQFVLDPWARVDGSIGLDPYTKRYNERWGRMALNLVGTGILDCSKAADPLTCYSQAFVRYDLSHYGPGYVTDYQQNWRSLGVPVGQIEGAKGLTAEQWLDPLGNGWSKPFVTAVARSELAERPFGGAYEVTFHLGPEVVLGRIERVQILLEASYWVKQQ